MIKTQKIRIDNAELAFRNFSGKPGDYNPPGRRNFCVILDAQTAEDLAKIGWNIRWLKPRDAEEVPKPYMQVEVSWKNIPPRKVCLISSKGKTLLGEEEVHILDWAEISNVDLIIRPYNWSVKGEQGIKAYLESIYVTIVEDELELKYLNVPDHASDAIGGCGNCEECDGSCNHDEPRT